MELSFESKSASVRAKKVDPLWSRTMALPALYLNLKVIKYTKSEYYVSIGFYEPWPSLKDDPSQSNDLYNNLFVLGRMC